MATNQNAQDILKLVVCSRYDNKKPRVGFVKGFGLKKGAFATTIAHDSHNIICVGTTDEDIVSAINHLIDIKGGISLSMDNENHDLPLGIAGLMTDSPIDMVSGKYRHIESMIWENGCSLTSPIMNLSFLSLLVIPELKLSDMGLFNVNDFKFVYLFADE